jgi:GNAT superfamily N-acetyltransferase
MMHPSIEVRAESLARSIWSIATNWNRGLLPHQRTPSQWYVIARLDDHVVGSLTVVPRQMSTGAESMCIAGLGNVITRPEYRLRGVASAMLHAAAGMMRTRLDVEFGVLFCRREVGPVYEKNGWIRVEGPIRFRQADGTKTYPSDTMVLKLTAREWPAGPIDSWGLPW